MTSIKQTRFKFRDRGKIDSLVLIPGWASDYRIFETLNLEFNYLIPDMLYPDTFSEGFLKALKENSIKKISLFGWSLGGFLASTFAAKHKDLVDKLILVSVRKKYKEDEIALVRNSLKKNKKGYLYKFYTQCFPKRENMAWFRKNLLKSYCENLNLDYLLTTLDYLGKSTIDTASLKKIEKIKIIHGGNDKIAPIGEARDIAQDIEASDFVSIDTAGHMPFLEGDFSRIL